MIKLVYCLRRRGSLSLQEFLNYWYEQHAPLVRKHAPLIGLIRYVQSHGVGHPLDELLRQSRTAAQAYDGIAELYYESAEALWQSMADPAVQAAGLELLEDEKQFIDLRASVLFLCEEKHILGDGTGFGDSASN
ncbi:MAG: EthD domain-containing protein [Dyella sp.]|nr:EthD domain-containing protein [Dyella sp.]MBV8272013.1 EthD domain-containing protein [Cupriavidus sp.]